MYAILIGSNLMLSLIFYHMFPSGLFYYHPCYFGIITNDSFIMMVSIPSTECLSLSPFDICKIYKELNQMACASPVLYSFLQKYFREYFYLHADFTFRKSQDSLTVSKKTKIRKEMKEYSEYSLSSFKWSFKKSSNPTSDSENKSGEGSLHCALTKTSMAIVSLPLESIHRKPSHQVVWTELKQVSSKLKNIFKGLKQIIL